MIVLWTCRTGKRTEPRLFETYLCCFNRLSNMFEVQIPIKRDLAEFLHRTEPLKSTYTKQDMLKGVTRVRIYTRCEKEVSCWIYEQHFPFNAEKPFHIQPTIFTMQVQRKIIKLKVDALTLEMVKLSKRLDELYKM